MPVIFGQIHFATMQTHLITHVCVCVFTGPCLLYKLQRCINTIILHHTQSNLIYLQLDINTEWVGLFEEASGFGLRSHQHGGLVLVSDMDLKKTEKTKQ